MSCHECNFEGFHRDFDGTWLEDCECMIVKETPSAEAISVKMYPTSNYDYNDFKLRII